jgi:hypothetical protein
MITVNMLDRKNGQAGNVTIAPNTPVSELFGSLSWSVEDAQFEGKACKLFKAESTWRFFQRRRDRSKVWFSTKVYLFAWLDPAAARLIRTQSTLTGLGVQTQIDARYGSETVDLTIVEGRRIREASLYPKVPMEQFHDLFRPFMRDGIALDRQPRTIAFIHPLTGAPVQARLKLEGRFDGKMQYLQRTGHRLKAFSPGGIAEAFVSREGRVLTVNMADDFQASVQEALSKDEIDNWGKFNPDQWDVPASVTHPQRTRGVTIMAPILLGQPKLIFPYPVLVAL